MTTLADQATKFLKYLGLEVKSVKVEIPKRIGINVVESSYHALRARQHNPDYIKVGNIELRRTNFVIKRIHTYEVWHVEPDFPITKLGILEVLIRAQDRNCLVILEPAK